MPAGQARVKLLALIVAAFIGLLNVARTTVRMSTPVTAGVAVTGDVAVMVGTRVTLGVPRIGSSPPLPQAASTKSSPAPMAPRKISKGFWIRFMAASWRRGSIGVMQAMMGFSRRAQRRQCAAVHSSDKARVGTGS